LATPHHVGIAPRPWPVPARADHSGGTVRKQLGGAPSRIFAQR